MENFKLPKCHTVSRYTGKRNFIYTSKKSADLPRAEFYETHKPWKCLLKFYAEFVLNSKMNVESKDINSFRETDPYLSSLADFTHCIFRSLTSARCCNYSHMCSWWWAELPPGTCRAAYRNIINCTKSHLVGQLLTLINDAQTPEH
jgi:hypothetical protein